MLNFLRPIVIQSPKYLAITNKTLVRLFCQFLNGLQWVSRNSTFIFILEESRGPIHGTVTRELDMNGFWDFRQMLVYNAAGLLNFIDSFSFKRVRIE